MDLEIEQYARKAKLRQQSEERRRLLREEQEQKYAKRPPRPKPRSDKPNLLQQSTIQPTKKSISTPSPVGKRNSSCESTSRRPVPGFISSPQQPFDSPASSISMSQQSPFRIISVESETKYTTPQTSPEKTTRKKQDDGSSSSSSSSSSDWSKYYENGQNSVASVNSSKQVNMSFDAKGEFELSNEDESSDDDSDGFLQASQVQLDTSSAKQQPAFDECSSIAEADSLMNESAKTGVSQQQPHKFELDRSPRNPLTLMKKNTLDLKTIEKLSESQSHYDTLWDDDDVVYSAASSRRRKRTNSVQQRPSEPDQGVLGQIVNTGIGQSLNSSATLEESPAMSYSRYQPLTLTSNVTSSKINCNRTSAYPRFEKPLYGPHETGPLLLDDKKLLKVPASICQYLYPYQQHGIKFVYQSLQKSHGCILGDDMGLGKTVQIIALLSALLRKNGDDSDLTELQQRRDDVMGKIAHAERLRHEKLQQGILCTETVDDSTFCTNRKYGPILIVVPPSVVDHWKKDLSTWGHFGVAMHTSTKCEDALREIRTGMAEIVVCARSTFCNSEAFTNIASIPWKLLIVDEFHTSKSQDSISSKHIRQLTSTHKCRIVGLTGTLMQNDHKELWNLVDLVVPDYFGEWHTFEEEYAKPIKFARQKAASKDAVQLGHDKSFELSTKLLQIFIYRSKEEVLGDVLPSKEERIVFCEPSELQKAVIEHILSMPDFVLLKQAHSPCDCGVNQSFFLEYQNLRTKGEKVQYHRSNKHKIMKRGDCCYSAPVIPNSGGKIDPRAVLYNEKDHVECKSCPHCIFFPAMHIYQKATAHIALLQAEIDPYTCACDSAQAQKAKKDYDRARVFIPKSVLDRLNCSLVRQSGATDNHFELSGKMKVLDKLLASIEAKRGRVLLFSKSTQTLDLIQNYIESKALKYLRMDGSTLSSKRNDIAENFRTDRSIFVFLLSTKAMGLGLNLTSANNVIIFDAEWNPSWDKQAQDRSYRIGQTQDVKVFRLICRGTMEELIYLRQVYKTQLKEETMIDPTARDARDISMRLFRGVAGDKDRKGELFGTANILKYKDGTFMQYSTDNNESSAYGIGVHKADGVLNQLKNMGQDEVDELINGEVFAGFGKRKCHFSTIDTPNNDNSDDESIIGGESQNFMDVCDNIKLPESAAHSVDSTTSISVQSKSSAKRSKIYLPCIDEDRPICGDSEHQSDHLLPIKSKKRQKKTLGNVAKKAEPVKKAEPAKEFSSRLETVEHKTLKTKSTVSMAIERSIPEEISNLDNTHSGNTSKTKQSNAQFVGTTTNRIASSKGQNNTTFCAGDFPRPRSKSKKIG